MNLIKELLGIFVLGSGVLLADTVEVKQVKSHKYPEYHNRMAVFGPFHQAYERIKTDAFYVGVEGWYLPLHSNKFYHKGAIWEGELRFGHNFFFRGQDHLTPFIGGGAFRDTRESELTYYEFVNWSLKETDHRSTSRGVVGYGTLGAKYWHEFNSYFNLGIDFKGLVGGSFESKTRQSWGGVVYGLDVALPMTFLFGKDHHWDVRIEPFNLYITGPNYDADYFGLRSTIGYRF